MNKKALYIVATIISAVIAAMTFGYLVYEWFPFGPDLVHLRTNLVLILFLFSFYTLLICINKLSTKKSSNNDKMIDEIIKYKALLDEGIVTQEEFDEKKKELLLLKNEKEKAATPKTYLSAIIGLVIVVIISVFLYLNTFSELTGEIVELYDSFGGHDTITISTPEGKHTVEADYKELGLNLSDIVHVKCQTTWDNTRRVVSVKKLG